LRREQAKAGERSSETADFFEKKSGVLVRVLGADTVLATVSAAVLDEYVSTRRREASPTTASTRSSSSSARR
jgi:hypothetical protein